MSYTRSVELTVGYEDAVTLVRETFQAHGFGTLTEIDVRATLRDKLGVDREPYLILGACNPQLAHRALTAEPEIGALLPCNVVVRASGTGARVDALDPAIMADLAGNPALAPVAAEAARLVGQALEQLAAHAGA